MGLNEALIRIKAIEEQAQVMGANDYEPSAFKKLLQSLEEGGVTPAEAITQAEGILNNKQDYH